MVCRYIHDTREKNIRAKYTVLHLGTITVDLVIPALLFYETARLTLFHGHLLCHFLPSFGQYSLEQMDDVQLGHVNLVIPALLFYETARLTLFHGHLLCHFLPSFGQQSPQVNLSVPVKYQVVTKG